ncbi:MAG: RDD family protein [Luteolibacter sp.]
MDFWIIRDGEKAGPFPDYEIRRKLEAGELVPTDPVWSDGMAVWTPVGEVPVFRVTLDRPRVLPPPLPAHAIPAPPAWRRFWARMFDFMFYGVLLWGGLSLAGVDLKALMNNKWFVALHLIPWFAIEAALIHWFGTTPGKALLGLKVLNQDGSRLSFPQSFQRAALVCAAGVGLGIGFLFPICLAISWASLRRMGVSLWDFVGGHQIVESQSSPWRIVAFVLLFLAVMETQARILKPTMFDLTPEELAQLPDWARDMYEQARQR